VTKPIDPSPEGIEDIRQALTEALALLTHLKEIVQADYSIAGPLQFAFLDAMLASYIEDTNRRTDFTQEEKERAIATAVETVERFRKLAHAENV
jgi:hypothetical protein